MKRKTLPFIQAGAANGYQLHVVMLDLDHFKVFNDTQGRQAGASRRVAGSPARSGCSHRDC
jgi:GGDEF domain-containing protein